MEEGNTEKTKGCECDCNCGCDAGDGCKCTTGECNCTECSVAKNGTTDY